MRLIYSRLVPAQVSNEVFWSRYFFRASGLEEEHGRRMRLLERVGEGVGPLALGEEAEWGEDEDAAAHRPAPGSRPRRCASE